MPAKNQLNRDIELAVAVRIRKPAGKTVTFGKVKLAEFQGKNSARDAGIYRRNLVDEIWRVLGASIERKAKRRASATGDAPGGAS